jgi:glucose-6-phosphate isomerase
MLTSNIKFQSFKSKNKKKIITNILKNIKKQFDNKSDLFLQSLSVNYKNSFNINNLKKYKKFDLYDLIGMGGSSLGAKAIYSFLNDRIKKKFNFIDSIDTQKKYSADKKLNIVISKSGNTLETIVNLNTKKNIKNSIFITESKNNYLRKIAKEINKEIFEHRDYISGRYSVLSETGMLPACLMGLDTKKFKRIDYLIKDKNFQNQLVYNVSSILDFHNKKKTNSIILNYDSRSNDLFSWYQQLVAESLGKKSKGLLPIISTMPKDNHSLMQLYLDGNQNNFFTFFRVENRFSKKLNKKYLQNSHVYLSNKNTDDILKAQFEATQNVFRSKKIPFRSFVVKNRDEKTLGELFCFFILETIMIGKALRINPFNQPEVELIKKETYKILKG